MFCCGWYIVVPSVVRKLIIEIIIECQGLIRGREGTRGHLRGAGSRDMDDMDVTPEVVEFTRPDTQRRDHTVSPYRPGTVHCRCRTDPSRGF